MNGSNTWVRIAFCRDIPMREGRAVKVGNRDLAIFNLGDRFLAIENRCPHNGGPLADGIVSGAAVVCPLHAWKMSLETGKGVSGPSQSSCVQTFRTRVQDGVVLLNVSDMRQEYEGAAGAELAAICVEAREIAEITNYTSSPEV